MGNTHRKVDPFLDDIGNPVQQQQSRPNCGVGIQKGVKHGA